MAEQGTDIAYDTNVAKNLTLYTYKMVFRHNGVEIRSTEVDFNKQLVKENMVFTY